MIEVINIDTRTSSKDNFAFPGPSTLIDLRLPTPPLRLQLLIHLKQPGELDLYDSIGRCALHSTPFSIIERI